LSPDPGVYGLRRHSLGPYFFHEAVDRTGDHVRVVLGGEVLSTRIPLQIRVQVPGEELAKTYLLGNYSA
jgi:hypothetical protein